MVLVGLLQPACVNSTTPSSVGRGQQRRYLIAVFIADTPANHLFDIALQTHECHLHRGEALGLGIGLLAAVEHSLESAIGHHGHDREDADSDQQFQQREAVLCAGAWLIGFARYNPAAW